MATISRQAVEPAASAESAPTGSRELPAGVVRQQRYRDAYGRRRTRWRDSQTIYRELVRAHVGPRTRVLDIGCGHADFLASAYAASEEVYGLDPDEQALERNLTVGHRVVGTVEKIPLPDQSFDLVTMAWVVEHLEDPDQAAREIHRVLRPGGRLLFLTPNAWNYNAWMVRMVPNRYHEWFTRRLYGRQDRDTYPVRYRMNTERDVERVMEAAGLRRVLFRRNGDPSYISFNDTLFTVACGIETLLELPGLRRAKVHLIGLYRR